MCVSATPVGRAATQCTASAMSVLYAEVSSKEAKLTFKVIWGDTHGSLTYFRDFKRGWG